MKIIDMCKCLYKFIVEVVFDYDIMLMLIAVSVLILSIYNILK